MNIIELRKADPVRGWAEVPASCPAKFVQQICEQRSIAIDTGRPIEVALHSSVVARHGLRSNAPIVRTREKSLEQQYFELTGREFVSDQDLRWRLAHVGWQIRNEAAKLAASKPSPAETEQAARNAAIVRAELFPWEN